MQSAAENYKKSIHSPLQKENLCVRIPFRGALMILLQRLLSSKVQFVLLHTIGSLYIKKEELSVRLTVRQCGDLS